MALVSAESNECELWVKVVELRGTEVRRTEDALIWLTMERDSAFKISCALRRTSATISLDITDKEVLKEEKLVTAELRADGLEDPI